MLEKEGSDLDIFIAGSYNNEEIKRKCYTLKNFEKNLTNDILLKEVLKNHVIFLNGNKEGLSLIEPNSDLAKRKKGINFK